MFHVSSPFSVAAMNDVIHCVYVEHCSAILLPRKLTWILFGMPVAQFPSSDTLLSVVNIDAGAALASSRRQQPEHRHLLPRHCSRCLGGTAQAASPALLHGQRLGCMIQLAARHWCCRGLEGTCYDLLCCSTGSCSAAHNAKR
jgi:hypothetical protein